MKIVANNGVHIVTRHKRKTYLWNKLTKRTRADYSVYHHFGGALYGRHDVRSNLHDKKGLRTVQRAIVRLLLAETKKGGGVLEQIVV